MGIHPVPQRPSRQGWILLTLAIVTEVTGSLTMKVSATHPWGYVVVAVAYTAAIFLLARVLHTGMPLGTAYGIWGAVGVAATAGLSALIFGEALTPTMIVGIVLVAAGVLLVESNASAHSDGAKDTA